MGYTTDFDGSVQIEPALNEHEVAFLTEFAETRRMNRTEGPLFAKNDGDFGQTATPGIIDYNRPHPDQPGLWNQWKPTETGKELEWDGGEKFYNSPEWMKYIIENLLAPSARAYIDAHLGEDERLQHFTCDHVVNGVIDAQGEDAADRWALVVVNNVVSVAEAELTYQNPRAI